MSSSTFIGTGSFGAPVSPGGGGFVPRGVYDAGTTYNLFDLVSYLGSSYVALGSTTGNLPTNTVFWQVVANKGIDGATGEAGPAGPAGPAGQNFVQTQGSLITITSGSPSATLPQVYRQPVLLQNNATLTLPAPTAYLELVAEILQDGAGNKTVIWAVPVGWTILWNGSVDPHPLNLGANKRTDQQFRFFPTDLLIRASNIWIHL